MTEIIFASNNSHKLQEIRDILGNQYKVLSLKDVNFYEEIIEDADSLEGNAKIKAKTIWNIFKKPCFADDTGLEVDALNGEPGVHSARYAGIEHNDAANLKKLLANMEHVPNRAARFRTAICLIFDGNPIFFDGEVKGEISHAAAGKMGFGYDPVFVPHGYNISFAEMSDLEKNLISHRGMAVRKLAEFLLNHKP
jgi:XTP/dITP diphosphohydrolase